MQQEENNREHKLIFHPKWDKGISREDRELITKIYHEHRISALNQIRIIPIRAGKNYKQHLFATVLIQNGAEEPIHFIHKKIAYIDQTGNHIEQLFNIPDLIITANSSTPWTFIFDSEKVMAEELGESKWVIQLESVRK